MKATIALCVVVLGITVATATSANQFTCDEPRGMRAEHGDFFSLDGSRFQRAEDGVKWSEDGFSGVFPNVLIRAKGMVISWANAVPQSIRGLVDNGEKVYRIPIIGRDEISVWGVRAQSSTAEIWRFYENNQTLYMLQSTIALHLQDPLTAPSQAAIFVAHCKMK